MRQPSPNPVSLKYGAKTPPYSSANPHAGTDYSYYSDLAKTKPNPFWVAPETVLVTGVTVGTMCGNQIDFQSLDGKRKYRGCHSATIYVKQGQTYKEGIRMAKMGATGFASGAHLHLVMWVSGKRVDPYATINKLTKGEDMYKGKTAEKLYKEAVAWKERAKNCGDSVKVLKGKIRSLETKIAELTKVISNQQKEIARLSNKPVPPTPTSPSKSFWDILKEKLGVK